MRMYNPVLFGRHLHVLRKRAGMSIKDLSRNLGIDPKIYRMIEDGHSDALSDDMLYELSSLIGLKIALAPGVDPPPIPKERIEGEIQAIKKWVKR